MPHTLSCRTSFHESASQHQASQLPARLDGDGAIERPRFSIDFPPGFRSRTSARGDPCFVGKLGNEAKRAHEPSKQRFKEKHPRRSEGHVLRHGSNSWRVWALIVKRGGTLKTNEVTEALDLISTQVSIAARPLVSSGILKVEKLPGKGGQHAYSIGSRAVEVVR